MPILYAGGFLDEPSGRAERQIHLNARKIPERKLKGSLLCRELIFALPRKDMHGGRQSEGYSI